ncbi:MAG: hypothetical protein M0Z28_07120 [Rhodospirillales bacterium]|nr:hypothetical protein [Rhodospirillales bacterium]
MPERVRLLGLDFADLDVTQAAARIAARPAEAPFGYVVTPNADHLVRLARQPALLPLYQGAALCLLDSRVVRRAARALVLPVPRVATGSDLAARLLRRHVLPGERVTIVGLDRRHLPSLIAACDIAPPAHYDPPMGSTATRPSCGGRSISLWRTRRVSSFLPSVRRGRNGWRRRSRPPAAPPAPACASAPASTSSPARRSGRRSGCSAPGWSGCTGWPPIPAGSAAAI